MTENVFINVKNRSHMVTADVLVPDKGVEGVILAQAGRFGGWSLYVKDGKPAYTYNCLDQKRTSIASVEKLVPGKATIVSDFAYEGGPTPGKGGVGSISVNGKKVGEGRIAATNCWMSSLDEGTDVGRDDGTPVTEEYKVPFAFTGAIQKVEVKLR